MAFTPVNNWNVFNNKEYGQNNPVYTQTPGAAQANASMYGADVAANTARYGIDSKNQHFNQLFGMLSSGAGQLPAYNPGPAANVTVRGVLNPAQVQTQVNAARAGNDRTLATQNQATASSLAGRGFGSNSPLLQALTSSNNMSNMATNTGNERDIRLGAAQANAGHLLNTQQAAANAEAQRQSQILQARQQSLGSFSALLNALNS